GNRDGDDVGRRGVIAQEARRRRRLRPGSSDVSQHGHYRLPERRGQPARAAVRCGDSQGRLCRRARRFEEPRDRSPTVAARRHRLSRAADRRKHLQHGAAGAGAGAGSPLRRHRGAVSGVGRRLVEPPGRRPGQGIGLAARPMTSFNPISARCRLVLVTVAMLLGCLDPIITSPFASSTMLEVGAAGGVPGVQESELVLYFGRHMTDAGLTEWRYEPAFGEGLPANYVQWRFSLKPYNGGEVYSHHPFHPSRETFGELYSVTLEARLYLNGEYQTLVEGQALM